LRHSFERRAEDGFAFRRGDGGLGGGSGLGGRMRRLVGSRPLDAADGGFHFFETALELLELITDE
jgi:hypothetical protein